MKRSRTPISLKCPEVAVFFDLAVESARGILRGFMQFVKLNAPWNVNFVSKTVNDIDPSSLENWSGDGILAHIPNAEMLRVILSKNCPTVLLSRDYRDAAAEVQKSVSPPRFVRCDNAAIGRMAAEYFLQKTFQHFAYVAYSKPVCWCEERYLAFEETLQKHGFHPSRYLPPPTGEQADWFTQRDRLRDWLQALPKPVAVLAANDFRGRQVLEVCQRADIPVPYEVAVLGVDNDLPVCEMSYPSLSSIAIDWERAGFLCAETLDCLMKNRPPLHEGVYGPIRVESRNSTEFCQISDRLVVRILEIIRISRGENLRVGDILATLPVSERSAQERFKKVVGHSILEEIQCVRMKNICKIIRETELPFQEIARSFGFENANHLGQLFKKEFGMTMGEYRRGKSE